MSKNENRMIILICCAAFVLLWTPTIIGMFETNNEYKETCNAYCNCSITQDCNYTFDYEKVKDCECK